MYAGDRFVFCLDEPVIYALMNPGTIGLTHEFDLLYHYTELNGSRGEAKKQGCELESLILTVEPQILSGVLAYRDVKVSITKI